MEKRSRWGSITRAQRFVNGTIIADRVETKVLKTDTLHLNLNEAPVPAAAGMVYFDALSKGLKFSTAKNGFWWEKVAHSCKEILAMNPVAESGEYTVDFDGPSGPMEPVEVFCDMDTKGGGWTRITPCIAKDVLNGLMVSVDGASIAGIDNSCRPYTRDTQVIIPIITPSTSGVVLMSSSSMTMR